MTLFERVHAPSFAGLIGWLNSEPLGPAELEGHVVSLIDYAIAIERSRKPHTAQSNEIVSSG